MERIAVLGIIILLVLAFLLGWHQGKVQGTAESVPRVEMLEKRCHQLEQALIRIGQDPPLPQKKAGSDFKI